MSLVGALCPAGHSAGQKEQDGHESLPTVPNPQVLEADLARVHACVHVWAYRQGHACLCACLSVHAHACVHAGMYVCAHVCVHAY